MISRCGSPPLARRAASVRGTAMDGDRFTSTHAESRCGDELTGSAGAVHLRSREEQQSIPPVGPGHPRRFASRSRGEQDDLVWTSVPGDGSPPLARRADLLGDRLGPEQRFTSARAESTPPPARSRPCWAVHLHSRGERISRYVILGFSAGSPPLARRARDVGHRGPNLERFTSARAESAGVRSRES